MEHHRTLLVQIPGFLGVMRTTLNGLQRYDYARYIDTAYAIFLPILTQLAIVPGVLRLG